MKVSRRLRLPGRRSLTILLLLWAAVALGGCQKAQPNADVSALDQAGTWFDNVEQLRSIKATAGEMQQLALARQAGISDQGCVELLQLNHKRQQLFADGQNIAGLVSAGMAETSVLELARLNQLGLWSGEAQSLRLANLSDVVVLAVARRRATGQPVLSSVKITALHNVGITQKEIVEDIERGLTDQQADQLVYRRNYLAGGHRFVSQPRRRR